MWNRIRDHAHILTPAQAVRYLIVFPFWLIGIIVGAVAAVIFSAVRWCWAAGIVGAEQATAGRLPHVEPQVVAQWAVTLAVIAAIVVMLVR